MSLLNFNLEELVFMISFLFLSILVTSFSIETVKVMYFSGFFHKQVNCSSNSSASFFVIVRFILKNYRMTLGTLYFKLQRAVCSTSVTTMILNFTIFFIFNIFIFKFFLKISQIFAFLYESCCFFVKKFLF